VHQGRDDFFGYHNDSRFFQFEEIFRVSYNPGGRFVLFLLLCKFHKLSGQVHLFGSLIHNGLARGDIV